MENNKRYRTIDDILSDPEVLEILKPFEKNLKAKSIDYEIRNFQELTDWVKENKRVPEKVNSWNTERKMYSRLKGFRERPDKFQEYDELGLLVSEEPSIYERLIEEIKNDTYSKQPTSLDDILDSESILFDGLENIDSSMPKLFETKKVKKNRKRKVAPDSIARRKKVEDFSQYKILFKKIQQELTSGKGQLKPFKNNNVEVDHFYVLKGQLIYIDSLGEIVSKNNANGIYEDQRLRVIYENGTESNLLKRGLVSSLYGRDGKIITELNENIELSNDDFETGYIYVIKSLSDNPDIANIKSLYKIGVTTGSVQTRIANARNESTYLYAPVKVVEQMRVINLDAHSLETALHHALAQYQLDVEIKAPNGKIITPREWFVVELSKVEEIVNRIVARLQSEL